MPQTTVTVKDIWLPEGKKRWVLKTPDDKMYGVPPALASQIQKGLAYNLGYKIDTWNNKQYLVVETVAPAKLSESTSPAMPPPSYSNNPGAAIMGMVNQFIARGDVPLDSKSMADLINKCKAGYEMSDLWPKKPKPTDELNDEIPY